MLYESRKKCFCYSRMKPIPHIVHKVYVNLHCEGEVDRSKTQTQGAFSVAEKIVLSKSHFSENWYKINKFSEYMV